LVFASCRRRTVLVAAHHWSRHDRPKKIDQYKILWRVSPKIFICPGLFPAVEGILVQTSMNTDESQLVSARALPKRSHWNSNLRSDLSAALSKVRADSFTLYLKTKNFRSHVCGPHFREYHPLLEAQAEQLFAMTDAITKLVRKMKIDSGCIDCLDLLRASDEQVVDFVSPEDVLAELRVDNQILAGSLRSARVSCQRCADIETGSLIDVWIDETRRRAWFLFEVTRSD
jgi:starvation-inducible DNA-binding protein